MIASKVFSPIDLLSYQYILSMVSEEFGGVKTAYYYDLLMRQRIAKQLERKVQNLAPFLTELDIELVNIAKTKCAVAMQ